MKNKALLSLFLVALVGLFDSTSAMKRKLEDLKDSKENQLNKKVKPLTQEEKDVEVTNLENLEELKPKNKWGVFPEEIWLKIREFFDKKSFNAWLRLCKKAYNVTYVYDNNGNQNPYLINNLRPGYADMTLEDAIKARNAYFVTWFVNNVAQAQLIINTVLENAADNDDVDTAQFIVDTPVLMALVIPSCADKVALMILPKLENITDINVALLKRLVGNTTLITRLTEDGADGVLLLAFHFGGNNLTEILNVLLGNTTFMARITRKGFNKLPRMYYTDHLKALKENEHIKKLLGL